MNSTFKISALAVLVSVGLTACSGYKDKSPAQSTPTVINKQDNIKKPTQPEKKAEQTKPATPTTPTTKVEQPKSEAKPEVKPETKAEQPTSIPDAVSNKPSSTDLVAINPEQPKPEVKPEQPKPEVKPEPKITQKGKGVTADTLPEAQLSQIVSVDSQNNKWRIVKMNGVEAASSNSIDTYRDYYYGSKLINSDANVCGGYTCSGNAIRYDSGVNSITTFDLTELAQKDGKPFLGVHSGSFTDNDFSGYVIDA